MKVYQTNATLGYRQLAFLIRLDKSEHGYNYLCIGTQNLNDCDSYQIGEVVKDLEDYYLEETLYKITDSPLSETFLFDYFTSSFCPVVNCTTCKHQEVSKYVEPCYGCSKYSNHQLKSIFG